MKSYRWRQLHSLVGLSRSTIFRLEKQGLFPKRRQLGKKSVCWLADEIDAWLTNRPIAGENEHD